MAFRIWIAIAACSFSADSSDTKTLFKPKMAFMGVRSSWPTAAMKSSRCACAERRASCVCSRSALRAAKSRSFAFRIQSYKAMARIKKNITFSFERMASSGEKISGVTRPLLPLNETAAKWKKLSKTINSSQINDQRKPNNINAATGMTGIHEILGELTPPVLKITKLRKEAEKITKT